MMQKDLTKNIHRFAEEIYRFYSMANDKVKITMSFAVKINYLP